MPRNTVTTDMELCRTLGHAWDQFYPDDMGTPLYGWRLSLRCTRCRSERHDIVDQHGRINARRYIYVEGYHMSRDETPTRDELRAAMYERIRVKLNKAHAIGSFEHLIEEEAS